MSQAQLVTSAEVCTALSIDRSTLTRWVASGRIQSAMKMPGKRGAFLFAPTEVERVKRELAGGQTTEHVGRTTEATTATR